MKKDKMIPMTAFRIPFNVDIPPCGDLLLIWLMTFQFKGLLWYMDRTWMPGRSGAVCKR
jgi:hypothetical protein